MKKIILLLTASMLFAACSQKSTKHDDANNPTSFQMVRNESKNTKYGKPITLAQYKARYSKNVKVSKVANKGRSLASAGGTSSTSCVPYATVIYTGSNWSPGTVTVTNDVNDLIIAVSADTANGWYFRSLFIWVGTGAIPLTGGGWPDLGQYPYFSYLGTVQAAYEYRIPLNTLNFPTACGAGFNVSVRTEMEQYSGATLLQSHYGFALTPNPVFTGCAECYFPYKICCGEPANCGCSYTQGYWKNHSKYAKKPAQKKPWPISEDTMLCGQSWFNILNTPPSGGNAWLILAHQWIAAKLNQASGASVPPMVATALSAGGAMLSSNCSTIPAGIKPTALSYATLLDNYNNGLLGPGHCE